jgi:hypothetical protein
LFVALPLSGVVNYLFGLTFFTTGWFLSLALILPVGTISYIVFIELLQVRYRNPPINSDFQDMIGRVHQKMLVTSRAQVWVRESSAPFIVSTYNLLFDAVIVSEPMVDLILKRPEAGEVLLAFHLVRIPRTRWFGDYVGSLILIVILTFLSTMILVPLISSLLYLLPMGAWMVIAMASSLGPYLIIPIFIAFIIKGSFWRHEPAFMRILEAYGMHPQIAKVEVERGTPLIEEEEQAVIWGVREWEKRKRSARRWGISAIATIPIGLTLLFVTVFVSIPYSPYLFFVLMYVPFIAALLIGVIIYFVIRRWDNNAMGEVFVQTTDSHEPIWMD